MTLLVNLYGSPGSGKTTLKSGLLYKLRTEGYNVEEVSEHARELALDGIDVSNACQPYLLGMQLNYIQRVFEKTDCIITDSPLLLCYYYAEKQVDGRYPKSYYNYVLDCSNSFYQLNFYLTRDKSYTYNNIGRVQTEKESDTISDDQWQFLQRHRICVEKANFDEIYAAIKLELDFNNTK